MVCTEPLVVKQAGPRIRHCANNETDLEIATSDMTLAHMLKLRCHMKQEDDDSSSPFGLQRGIFGVNSLSPSSTTNRSALPFQSCDKSNTNRRIDQDNNVQRARLVLLGTAALYGTNFSVVKLMGQASIPVGASCTLRFGLAVLATYRWLLPARQQNGRLWTRLDREQWKAVILGFEVGIYNAMGYVVQAIGLKTTSASTAAFVYCLVVLVVPCLEFCKGKYIVRHQLLGTLLAILGVALLQLGDGFVWGSWTGASIDCAILAQPLCFGMGFWRMEHLMSKYPDQAKQSTAAQLLAVFIVCWIYSSLAEPGALRIAQALTWLSDVRILFGLLWTGFITTAMTVYMETVALKTLTAAETTLIYSTEPIWGAVCARAVIGEQLGANGMLGSALILLGCVSSSLGGSDKT